MVFRSVQVPAAAHTANRNPIVDSWNKSHDNAVHSFVQAITSVAALPGVFSARRELHPTGASGTQFLDRARPPIAASHDRDILREMPPKLIVEEGNRKPLLYIRSSTCLGPAALLTREEVR
jgi:hypothetical protein